MTLTYFNDINVYFHMKNHYKMLKQVKSVIDTSIPQSLLKSPVAMQMQGLQKRLKGTTNEQLRTIYNSPIYMPKRGGQVKRHNCLKSEAKSEASLRTGSLPSRPTTRRNSTVTPKGTLNQRSCSVGPPAKTEKMLKFIQKKRPSVSSTRSSNSENQNTNLQLDLDKENIKSPSESPPSTKRSPGSKNSNNNNNEGPENSPKGPDNSFLKESSEEHDYLLFLLRITEDIIVNDFYSNNDIKQVFKFHVDANKYRLNVRKMHFHIANLCRELNIDCKEYQNNDFIENNQLDSPGKFKNFPPSRSCYLNNESYLNCQDCSAIRTSSLYKLPSSFKDNGQMKDGIDIPQMDNGDNDSSISPSLLRLLEKLSLGRVTECTEPAASSSSINSPNLKHNIRKEDSKMYDKENSNMDFDSFVKVLNSKENMMALQNKTPKETVALESPPVQIFAAPVEDRPVENRNFLANQHIALSSKSYLKDCLNSPKLSSTHNSKSEIEESEKDFKSINNSEKYESEFENSYSSNSISKGDKSEKSDEEKMKDDENTQEKKAKAIESGTSLVRNELSGELKDSENNKSHFATSLDEVVDLRNKKAILPESLPSVNSSSIKTEDSNTFSEKVTSNLGPTKTHQLKDKDTESARNEIIYNQPNPSGQTLLNTASNKASLQPREVSLDKAKDTVLQESSPERPREFSNLPETDTRKSLDRSDHQKQDTMLKLILQGSLNDDDYVMIKGPVYVYRPLLESDPKLVVFSNEGNFKSGRNSVDSQHSNRTFTVINSQVREQVDANEQVELHNVGEAVQFDQSLHSLVDDSMENILELTRRTYNQFTDSKLLQPDYDLTPQKDSDDKYHHLMVDASTSISGTNIKESLLLSDAYLVKADENQQQVFNGINVHEDYNGVNDIDNYLKFETKLVENNYVIPRNRRLISSVSMPKLMTRNEISEERSYDTSDGREKNGEFLLGYSTDLMNFDIPSQDSSLRSEGESYQNVDKLKKTIPWGSYLN